MFRLPDCEKVTPPNVGSPIYLWPIKPSDISAVALGVRCTNETRQRVRNMLAENGLGHVRLYGVIPHLLKYAMMFAPVDSSGEMQLSLTEDLPD